MYLLVDRSVHSRALLLCLKFYGFPISMDTSPQQDVEDGPDSSDPNADPPGVSNTSGNKEAAKKSAVALLKRSLPNSNLTSTSDSDGERLCLIE